MTRTSRIKFNHVFAALMLLSAVGAFAVPQRYTTKLQPQVQNLFSPVARPVRSVAGWAHDRLATPAAPDPRDPGVLAAENESLRQEIATLYYRVATLERINEERAAVGDLRQVCTPVAVDGDDTSGSRRGLLLRGSTLDGLAQGQPVLYGYSIAGRIERAPGLLGAQVRLVTDPGMRVSAVFARLLVDEATGKLRLTPLKTSPVLVEGLGDGAMRCATALTVAELEAEDVKLHAGDWVLLEDNEWDERVQGRLLGRVARVARQNAAPLYADIRIEPTKNLSRLREVMVLTK
jgi:cell shape-determining protein MreC